MRRLVVIALLAAAPLGAQSDSLSRDDRSPRSRIAWSIGLPGWREETHPMLASVGVQLTATRPFRLGPDVGVAVLPIGLPFVPVITRIGVAFPLAFVPGTTLLPSGGVSAAGAIGSDGFALAGSQMGLSLVQLGARGGGVRIGGTLHFLAGTNGPIWHAEVGFIPRRRR